MEYLSYLNDLFEKNKNDDYAPKMSKYMRNQFQFYGINSPQRTKILQQFLQENGLPKPEKLSEILAIMWEKPQREWQYAALYIFQKIIKKSKNDFLELAESLIIQKSWWDTIDTIAPTIVGEILLYLPEKKEEYTEKWALSDNFWLKRTSIIFQLHYKSKTNTDLLEKYILLNIESKEFFIQKAIGWALRQYARIDKEFVKNFVKKNENLSSLSKREALKHI
ncbi:MAG: DNA alkylation repair protein [Cytophagia bacterium]|nr:MAG: DNA alkylation repair protein [Cytophagales bacterium]TAG02819.1 MAG: DNA alkylation repair protein [Cytophagia bacterium]TAG42204.1 MAG: DNA alkylation repair protein [Cytophagia bacterium]